jgi:Cu-Zn family superoxide dismutase
MRYSRTKPSLLALTVLLAAGGCGSNGETPTVMSQLSAAPAPAQTTTAPAVASAPAARTDGGTEYRGVFLPWADGANAVTYDPAVVPAGATAVLATVRSADGVTVRLALTGMVPRRAYGAHLHTDPCAAVPAQAGPHYQHAPDPKAVASPPSVDPAFANPRNEVWLDFTADTLGTATVSATQPWPFDEINPPRSLIVHAEQTKTAAGKAGTAGPRVACLTLPL